MWLVGLEPIWNQVGYALARAAGGNNWTNSRLCMVELGNLRDTIWQTATILRTSFPVRNGA